MYSGLQENSRGRMSPTMNRWMSFFMGVEFKALTVQLNDDPQARYKIDQQNTNAGTGIALNKTTGC
jgi:hypothetical protein